MIKVQQAAHDIPKKRCPRTQHSSQRPPAAFKLVFTASPGEVQFETLRHVKCGPFAQRPGPEYAGCCFHILLSRSVPSWQWVANFSKHLAISTGNCAVSTDPIYAKLVMRGSPAQAAAFELCCARDLCLPGMLRYSHRLYMQKDLVRGRRARLG